VPNVAKKKIRVMIADQEGIFRFGLKRLFGSEDDLRVTAQAADPGETLSMADEFKPDLIFLQAEMVRQDDSGLFFHLHHDLPETKIVITASDLSDEEAVSYVQNGAAGVILKTVDPELFVKCARKVMENEVWLPKKQVAQMAKLLEGSEPARPRDTLTSREKTIISYLMQGWRNREIGQHLGITEQTVKNHLRAIYDKVGVSDRLELVLYAIHQRLELPPIGPAESPSTKPAGANVTVSSHDEA
jgi:two-component system, NarL family, nitrate/nitrite response regulator NarL